MSKSVIESLVGMDDKVFFSSYWEQRPLVSVDLVDQESDHRYLIILHNSDLIYL